MKEKKFLDKITRKQKEILLHLYRFRFLNRTQIQILLNHKNPNRTNSWLKNLVDNKYIGRIKDESKFPSTPLIYYLLKGSIPYLKTVPTCEKKYLVKIYKEGNRTEYYRKLSLFIADTYIYLMQKYKNIKDFIFYTQSNYSPKSVTKEIFPSFVYQKGKDKAFLIVEIFRNTTPYGAIRARLEEYFSNNYLVKNIKMFKLLFVCANDKQKKLVSDCTVKIMNDESLEFGVYLATLDKVKSEGFEGKIWSKVEV